MKKLFVFLSVPTVFFFNQASAQKMEHVYALNIMRQSAMDFMAGNERANAENDGTKVNSKAEKSFLKMYSGASGEKWALLKDKAILCVFSYKGVLNRAYYSKNGNWMYTVAGYEETRLPEDIRSMVKKYYCECAVDFVNEISVPGDEKIYLIQVQQGKSVKVVRVFRGEMEELDVDVLEN